MAINLYGNVSGTYQKPNIDLFEMARKQNNQPVKFCDTEAGKNLPAIKVNISEEGFNFDGGIVYEKVQNGGLCHYYGYCCNRRILYWCHIG